MMDISILNDNGASTWALLMGEGKAVQNVGLLFRAGLSLDVLR